MDIAFSRLNQLALGYWNAQVLFVLTDSGVFEAVAERPRSATELAKMSGLEFAGTEALLDGGVALGLLKKESGLYDSTEIARRFLLPSSPESLSHWVRVMGHWFRPWSRLKQSLVLGRPAEPQAPLIAEDPRYLETFIIGMHEYAQRSSDAVAAVVDLGGAKRLVDVGGGAGTYSIALCRRYAELSATILDQPPVLAIAERIVAAAGLRHRITASVTDYRASSFGEDVDAVLFSNVLHQENRSAGASMLERARAALKVNGKVVVHGHFLEEDRVSPVFATLHNLSARALWEGGHSYTATEMKELIEEAGFRDIRVLPVSKSATSAIIGHK